MKKKIKSWLIRVLRKWLAKLEPYHNVVKVEHTHVPLVTLEASVAIPKNRQHNFDDDNIGEILAKKLGEEVLNYADIQYCEKVDAIVFEEHIIYRATVRVATDKRG